MGVSIEAVRRVAEGGSALDSEVVARMLGRRGVSGPLARLTPRERLDAVRLQGPGTDLTIGLLPNSCWGSEGMETIDGLAHRRPLAALIAPARPVSASGTGPFDAAVQGSDCILGFGLE